MTAGPPSKPVSLALNAPRSCAIATAATAEAPITATTTASLIRSVPTLNLLHSDGWARGCTSRGPGWLPGPASPSKRWCACLHHAAHVGHAAAVAAAVLLGRLG